MLPFGVQLRGEGVTPAVGLRFDRHTVQRCTVVPAEAAVAKHPVGPGPIRASQRDVSWFPIVRLRPAGVWADAVASKGLNQPDLRIRGP